MTLLNLTADAELHTSSRSLLWTKRKGTCVNMVCHSIEITLRRRSKLKNKALRAKPMREAAPCWSTECIAARLRNPERAAGPSGAAEEVRYRICRGPSASARPAW